MTEAQQKKLDQLKSALDLGAIDQDTYDTAVQAIHATLVGSGAIAQGAAATAAGAQAVIVDGSNYGDINTGLIIQQAAKAGASKQDLRRAYLARVLVQANQLPLFAADSASAQIRLSSVYTALLTQRTTVKGSFDQKTQEFTAVLDSRAQHLSALDVFNQERHLVLLGGPGSGKSTFLNFVALCMAGALLGSTALNLKTLAAPLPPEPDSRDKEAKPQSWEHGALLPVTVVLRDFASELPPPGTPVNAKTLWKHISGRLTQAALKSFIPHLHEELLGRGGLILLDGLDEVPESMTRREQVKQAVQDFVATFSKCRILVTSRTYAYTRQDWKLNDFNSTELLPFTRGQINRFVDAWYAHMHELLRLSESDALGRTELLKHTITRNERLAELAERPLLLTLIARLHTEGGGSLPEKREKLYDQAVDLLLNQWESLKVHFKPDGTRATEPSLTEWLKAGRDDIRRVLDRLAFEVHRDQPELVGTADIQQDHLIHGLLAASPRDDVQPRLLEGYLRDRAGILAAHGAGLYQFPHRTFQEYLAACHLTTYQFPDEVSRLLRGDPNRWREATLLAAAKVARGTPDSVWNLIEALCAEGDPPAQGEPVPVDVWGALLAGQSLWETGLAQPDPALVPRNERKRAKVQRWVRAIVERGWLAPADRAIAGMALSVLGDDRDFDELILIPAGEYWVGDDADSDSKPKHRVKLLPFKIARYGVTNAQYGRFVTATSRAWDSPDATKPERRNHPAHTLDWHGAIAYCAWLTKEWRNLGKISQHEVVTLPSEVEWEAAARGSAGRIYPWGDDWQADCANTVESGIGDTCAVGMFPCGASAAGCLDMAGNVWEWTRSLWGADWQKPDYKYPYSPNDPKRENLKAGNDIKRVLRGGAWDDDRGLARAAYRLSLVPDLRSDYLGFRVVVRSAPVP